MLYASSHKIYRSDLVVKARELRKNSTVSEVLLWEQIKGRQLLGHKFRRQTPVGKYIVDFYCKELKLVIEVDGLTHDYKIEYDKQRQKYLEDSGLLILRINDIDVKKDIKNVIQRVADCVESRTVAANPPLPRPSGECHFVI